MSSHFYRPLRFLGLLPALLTCDKLSMWASQERQPPFDRWLYSYGHLPCKSDALIVVGRRAAEIFDKSFGWGTQILKVSSHGE